MRATRLMFCTLTATVMAGLVPAGPAVAADVAVDVQRVDYAKPLADGTSVSVGAWMNIDYTNNVIRAYTRVSKGPGPFGKNTEARLFQDGYAVQYDARESYGTEVLTWYTPVHGCGGGHGFRSYNTWGLLDASGVYNTGTIYSGLAQTACRR